MPRWLGTCAVLALALPGAAQASVSGTWRSEIFHPRWQQNLAFTLLLRQCNTHGAKIVQLGKALVQRLAGVK